MTGLNRKIGAPRRKGTALLCVALFATLTALAGSFTLPPLDRDEARFAQATAQMLETGDFLRIRFQDTERNKKPAGIYWLQAASVSAFSAVEDRTIWAYRIPSMAGVVVAAIFTFLAGARLYNVQTGFLAGLLLASAPVIAVEGTIAKTDGVLLALICMAQFAFIHLYRAHQQGRTSDWGPAIGFWAAQGAGVLIKGPIAPLVSFMTGLGLASVKPRLSWIGAMRPFSGLAILILMIAPWAAAIWMATEGRFFYDALGGDMLGKVGAAQEGHIGPPGYHAALVWLLFWPAAALILPGLVLTWRERDDWRARFLLSWAIPAWVIFELTATKLPHYVMPLYPALAIMAARAAVTGAGAGWPRKTGAILYAGAGLIAAALLALPPLYFGAASMAGLFYAAGAMTAVLSLLIAILFWKGRNFDGSVAAAILAALYAWTLLAGGLPNLPQLAVSPRLSAALEQADRHPLHDNEAPVALAGYAEPSAVFLLGTETKLTSPENAAKLLKTGAVSAAIIDARLSETFHTVLEDKKVAALAVIDGVNYSNGDSVSLTIYVLSP